MDSVSAFGWSPARQLSSPWRHRASLIQMAAEHVLHMQKALDQMNVQIHRVLNDITGVSGLKIIDSILAGERDPLANGGSLSWWSQEQRRHDCEVSRRRVSP